MVLPFVSAKIMKLRGRASLARQINSDGFVLIGRHPNNKPYPGAWDLPGGKLEENEAPEEGIAREVKEELGLEVVSAKLCDVFHHSADKFLDGYASLIPGIALCYEVEVKGDMRPTEQIDVHYASPAELRKMYLTPWTAHFLRGLHLQGGTL